MCVAGRGGGRGRSPLFVPRERSFHSVTRAPLKATTAVTSSGNFSACEPQIVISIDMPESSASLAVRFASSLPALVTIFVTGLTSETMPMTSTTAFGGLLAISEIGTNEYRILGMLAGSSAQSCTTPS